MKRKRFIKLLMADGYSRNDARQYADYVVLQCRRVSQNNAIMKTTFAYEKRIDINRYSYAAEFDRHADGGTRLSELLKMLVVEALRNPPSDKIIRKVRIIRGRQNGRTDTLEIAARACELNLEWVDY